MAPHDGREEREKALRRLSFLYQNVDPAVVENALDRATEGFEKAMLSGAILGGPAVRRSWILRSACREINAYVERLRRELEVASRKAERDARKAGLDQMVEAADSLRWDAAHEFLEKIKDPALTSKQLFPLESLPLLFPPGRWFEALTSVVLTLKPGRPREVALLILDGLSEDEVCDRLDLKGPAFCNNKARAVKALARSRAFHELVHALAAGENPPTPDRPGPGGGGTVPEFPRKARGKGSRGGAPVGSPPPPSTGPAPRAVRGPRRLSPQFEPLERREIPYGVNWTEEMESRPDERVASRRPAPTDAAAYAIPLGAEPIRAVAEVAIGAGRPTGHAVTRAAYLDLTSLQPFTANPSVMEWDRGGRAVAVIMDTPGLDTVGMTSTSGCPTPAVTTPEVVVVTSPVTLFVHDTEPTTLHGGRRRVSALLDLVEKALRLLVSNGGGKAANVERTAAGDADQSAEAQADRLRLSTAGPYNFVATGQYCTGKTSLINAMFGAGVDVTLKYVPDQGRVTVTNGEPAASCVGPFPLMTAPASKVLILGNGGVGKTTVIDAVLAAGVDIKVKDGHEAGPLTVVDLPGVGKMTSVDAVLVHRRYSYDAHGRLTVFDHAGTGTGTGKNMPVDDVPTWVVHDIHAGHGPGRVTVDGGGDGRDAASGLPVDLGGAVETPTEPSAWFGKVLGGINVLTLDARAAGSDGPMIPRPTSKAGGDPGTPGGGHGRGSFAPDDGSGERLWLPLEAMAAAPAAVADEGVGGGRQRGGYGARSLCTAGCCADAADAGVAPPPRPSDAPGRGPGSAVVVEQVRVCFYDIR